VTDVGKYVVVHESRGDGTTKILRLLQLELTAPA
jgi:hypothetical protein